MANFTEPCVLHNVLYDPVKRRLHVPTPIPKRECELPESLMVTTEPYDREIGEIKIEEPTYSMNYFHYCFAHAYIDTIIPVLSILDEIDSERVAARDFRFCIFHLLEEDYTINPNLIDIEAGTYKNELRYFHQAASKHPLLLELKKPHRFQTLILGGLYQHQRSIHNHISVYPERFVGEPHATEKQRQIWITKGRDVLGRWLGVSEPLKNKKPKVMVIARKENRTFLPKTLCDLKHMLSDRDDIDFMGVYYLEEMALREQIRLFQDADLVISTHGSGLCHLIWSKPGTKILEVFLTAEERLPIFGYLSKFMAHDYRLCVETDYTFKSDVSFDCGDAMFQALEELIKDPWKRAEELEDADRLICREI